MGDMSKEELWARNLAPLKRLKELAAYFKVECLCKIVLEDKRFPHWSGSSKPEQHHYGSGRLIEHTLEVVELCLQNNKFFPPNKQVEEHKVFLAALFHDVGKMWDYEWTDSSGWGGSWHKRNIHHISRSALVWNQVAIEHNLEYADEILHAILAHHGLREWGSPVAPNSRLAWLLHLCDGLSARMDDVGNWMLKEKK
jgi:3'-5' exoribonuclease